MSAYSTITITCEEAITKILELVDQATNEELSQALFALTADHVCDNYSVISKVAERKRQD